MYTLVLKDNNQIKPSRMPSQLPIESGKFNKWDTSEQ